MKSNRQVSISFGGGVTYGPEMFLKGKEGHIRALLEIFDATQELSEDQLALSIFVEQDGQFARPGEVKPGPHSFSYSRKSDEAQFFIGIPMEIIVDTEENFRRQLANYLHEGSVLIVEYLKKKKVLFDAEGITSQIDQVVDAYLARSLPIPTPKENREVWQRWMEATAIANDMADKRQPPIKGPINVTFYSYFKSHHNAEAFSKALGSLGYSTGVRESGPDWLCTAERVVQSDEDFEIAEETVGLHVITHRGHLDGWDYDASVD